MEEVKLEEKLLNRDKQGFLQDYKKLKESFEESKAQHNKKRDFDEISVSPQVAAPTPMMMGHEAKRKP